MDVGLQFGVFGGSFFVLFDYFVSVFFGTVPETIFGRFWVDFGDSFEDFLVTFWRPADLVIFATPPMRNHCF